jgi:hypothetical protein
LMNDDDTPPRHPAANEQATIAAHTELS